MHSLHLFTTGNITRHCLAVKNCALFDIVKVEKNQLLARKIALFFSTLMLIKCAVFLFLPAILPLSLYTFHLAHNNLRDKQQHIAVLHESPGILYIYSE
jgi:hypothetical protein